MNKRQAIAEVRSIANALIEQQERIAKGWDKGTHRDDETFPAPHNSIACKTRNLSRQAFTISKAFNA